MTVLKKLQQKSKNNEERKYSVTNKTKLKKRIDESGLKLGFIADKLDISYSWLKKKIDGDVAFKAYEIQTLCDLLDITDLQEKEDIFFANYVE